MAVFNTLDRLVRTDVPTWCNNVGLTADASSFSDRLVIDRASRVSSAATAMRAFEDRITVNWNSNWDPWWGARGFRALLVSATEITEALTGTTANERLLFKTSLRVAEYLMCRDAAGG